MFTWKMMGMDAPSFKTRSYIYIDIAVYCIV